MAVLVCNVSGPVLNLDRPLASAINNMSCNGDDKKRTICNNHSVCTVARGGGNKKVMMLLTALLG